MSRLHTVPIAFFLLCALVLSALTSISLPTLTTFPIVRTTFSNDTQVSIISNDTNGQGIDEIRFGIWSACYYDLQHAKGCFPSKNDAYSVLISTANETDTKIISSTFTHVLSFKPIAAAGIVLTLLFSFGISDGMVVIAFWLGLVSIVLNLISVGLDVATFFLVKKGMGQLPVGSQTIPGIGLWLNACTIALVALAAYILLMSHRSNKRPTDVGCCY